MTNVIEIKGERYFLLPESEYLRMIEQSLETAGLLPAYPPRDRSGNSPALDFARVNLAREIIRDRTACGLSQRDLASMVGVPQSTVARVESGKVSPTVRMVERIEAALLRAARKRRTQATQGRTSERKWSRS